MDRIKLVNLYIKTAETQMEHYDKQYNKELDQMLREQKSTSVDQQLTPVMVKLLEERTDNRKQRIKCVNQYKIHCLHSNSNYK
ncbi:unnamed protein product [Adineta steineri]|uniref:Uncharacterized protein n=1 Tax=Adineta steineri TaxID=433720 RepID=A0A819DBD8_9BILA|nr:unnamed protein product [Adineta steineri]